MTQVNPQRVRDGKIIEAISALVFEGRKEIEQRGDEARIDRIIMSPEDQIELMATPEKTLSMAAVFENGLLCKLFGIPVSIDDDAELTVTVNFDQPIRLSDCDGQITLD